MSIHTLHRWGGIFIIVMAALALIGGLIRFAALILEVGDLLLGQSLYSTAYLIGVFTFIALYTPHATRLGKSGFVGFILSTLGISLNSIPAFLWIAIATGQEWGHTALMYSWGNVPVLIIGGLSATIGYILFGIAVVRSGVYPRWAGYTLIASALINLLVELSMIGGVFTMFWPLSLVLYAISLTWMGFTLMHSERQSSTDTSIVSQVASA